MVIVIAGMISAGKTSVAKILGEHFNSKVFYESVEDNPLLPLFYGKDEEEILRNRYPFLLQLYFLNSRFKSIKEALREDNNILDRSIYEDLYFCRRNLELGRINDLEFSLYSDLLENMMEELKGLPKKSPDLLVYLKCSFETVLHRIALRGREYEVDENLKEYYRFIWEGYDEWVMNQYKASEVIVIDMDNMDVVNNDDDKKRLLKMIDVKLEKYEFINITCWRK